MRVLSILIFIWISPALASREWTCEKMGVGVAYLTSQECEEASAEEYELACAMSSFGNSYNHGAGGPDFKNFKRYGHSSMNDFAEEMTEEVLLNLAANNITESNRCMVNLYDEFLGNKNSKLASQTKQAFSSLKPKLDALLPASTGQFGAENRAAFLRPSSELVSKSRTIDRVLQDANDGRRVKFDGLIAGIPLGNHEEIRTYVARAVIENYDQEKFYSGFQEAVKGLQTKYKQTLDSMLTYRLNSNKAVFNIQKGERGSISLRQALKDSGAIENFIVANNMESRFEKGYLCRQIREERGCLALAALEVGGSFLLPYVAASMGLRAGILLARGASTTTKLPRFVHHAVERGLLYSGYVGQLAIIRDDVVTTCLSRYPEYVESKGRPSCEPEKMVFETVSESALSSCILTLVLGLDPIGTAGSLSEFLTKSSDEVSNGLEAVLESEVTEKSLTGVGLLTSVTDITVIARSALFKQLYFSNEAYKRIERNLTEKQLLTERPVSRDMWKKLTDGEKLFLVEYTTNRPMTDDQAVKLLNAFKEMDSRGYSDVLERRIARILHGEKFSPDDVPVIEDCICKLRDKNILNQK